jgi:proline iminopeptidase
MVDMPTLLLLHGGPGADHSIYKPAFSALTDVAQVVYLDHRGNGRSEHGHMADWTLAQWADDVRGFCDALGIVEPIVYGASFGGMVAMVHALRHPDHVGKLILDSTAGQITSRAQAKGRHVHAAGRGGQAPGAPLHRRRHRHRCAVSLAVRYCRCTPSPPDPCGHSASAPTLPPRPGSTGKAVKAGP